DELMAASLSVKPNEALIVPIGEFDDALKQLLSEDCLFVAHDAKLQQRRLAANGWPIPRRWADTMIMSYVINPGLPSHEFANVARDRLKQDVVTRKDVAKTAPLFAAEHALGSTAISVYVPYLGEKPT